MHVIGIGRTDVRVIREAKALVAAGYQVTVVDIERDTSRPREETIEGIHFKHVFMPNRFVKSRIKLWFLVKTARTILSSAWLMIRTPTDIYHAHEDNALYACYMAAVLRRKKLVFDAHELPYVQPNITRWRLLCGIARWTLRRMMPRCAGVMTVSPPIVDEIQRRYGGKRAVLVRNTPPYTAPITSNRLRERLGLPSTTRLALYQGGLEADRQLDIVVRAARYLAPDQHIVLLGSGASQAALEALITEEGVSQQVTILPPVPYAELLAWTASADVGLILYDGGYSPNVQYCLPNKLFEYLMAGVPVLATRLDAVEALVAQYQVGAITPALAPQAVGESIRSLLNDPAHLAQLRHNALRAAQQDLRWEVEQEQLLALYRSIQ
jgi:glycosyltransferase involved in cell wall biosynthesis